MKVCHRWKETGNNCEEFNNVVRNAEELEVKLKAAEQERDRLKEEYDGLDLAWKEERQENFRNVQRADLAEQEQERLKNKLQRALGALADIGWSADMEIDSSLQSKKARRIYNEIMEEK